MPPAPPVETRIQCLPFDALSWENFERLCHRLTALDADVEHCERFGQRGDAQEGIDIFARLSDGRYHCLQAKRHRKFGPAKLRKAVDLFLAGSWADRAARFTIAVQDSLRSPNAQEEIERQVERLAARSIKFAAVDGEGLTEQIRQQPALVDDFFGRPWVAALLGVEVAKSLGARLDGAAFARVRAQLARVYEAQFEFIDSGSFGSLGEDDGHAALSLLERFFKPDMLVHETVRSSERTDFIPAERQPGSGGSLPSPRIDTPDNTPLSGTGTTSRMRRLPVVEWLSDGDRMVVLGEAGYGKSTLLRAVALDLLHDQTHFPELAVRWGQYIPLYVPFARWSVQVSRDGHPIGIKEIVRRSLEQLLTESITVLLDGAINEGRVLMLIDGLDEWSNEQAARSTLNTLVTTVDAHRIPAIVSGRPRGLSRIGTLPATWKRGEVAPLLVAQQAAIAGRWFQRYAAAETTETGLSDGNLRTGRFMAELARDPNLAALAAVPLLLIGLITLALRGQILPRSRGDVYDQLVRVLLEVHPNSRATASGDTVSRFRYATDPDQRRAAIARLAFVARKEAGGAGMPLASAREVLRIYLASPQGFDLANADAVAAAGEILSVNAETQGLLIERAPGEVGFVHASFEEFLGAEHVGGWPFSDIEAFVRAHAAEGRWRNVIVNLLGRIQRRDELDRLVAIIEEPSSDELVRFQRQALLGDIAFGLAVRSPATAKRLALATIDRVEAEDWPPARRAALTSVVKGLADPALKGFVEPRLGRWLPARLSRRGRLVAALGKWIPSAELQETLWQAMHDENRGVQRTAAAVYSESFGESAEACQRLLVGLAGTRDLATAIAQLESLALGWPAAPEAALLFEEAWRSHSAELRLVGLLGLAATGAAPEEAREAVLHCQNYWSGLSLPHQDLAAAMLIRYWPGDDMLVEGALQRVSGDFGSLWEHEVAISYLMASPVERADVRAWILTELGKDFPFNTFRAAEMWAQLGRFALADSEIRSAANAYWCKPQSRLIGMSKMPGYVTRVADPPVATALIGMLAEKPTMLNRYWAVICLLAGWGRDHTVVKPALDALSETSDEDLVDLVALFAEIIPDKVAARERLIRMGVRQDVRRDLLTIGLEECGCNHTDNEAVAAILATPEVRRDPYDASAPLFRAFGAHPEVRALALERMNEAEGPLPEIAASYPNDPEFASVLFAAAVPLPVDLRTQIVEVAATGAAGTALEGVLGQCMLEADPELRARMVIAYHRALPPAAHAAAKEVLLTKAVEGGFNYENVRATALAGLVTVGGLGALVSLEDRGKPVTLETGSALKGIASVERLVCERFEDFEEAFGDSLSKRFQKHGSGSRLGGILAAAPGASTSARAAFLMLAERGEIPVTAQALGALAVERPRSQLLLAHCWDGLDDRELGNDRAMVAAEIGLILRDHFCGHADVRERLIKRFQAMPSIARAIPLAIYAPDAEVLGLPTEFSSLGQDFGDWLTVTHVAACRADTAAFCALLEAVVTRPRRSRFDAQPIINLAIVERIQADSILEGRLTARIAMDIDPSISGSFARYLAAAGKLNPEARGRTLDLLQTLGQIQRLPVAGYDAIADQWRAVRATLLDAVSAGLELA